MTEDFWDWLPKAYGEVGDEPSFTKYNMEVAFLAGKQASQPAQQEPAGWRPATFHRDNLSFNPGFPDEQTVKFWKLQGVEIEYCYTSPLLLSPGATLYTSPPAQRTWVGLTPEEIDEIIEDAIDSMDALFQTMDKLKEKNI